MNLKEFMEQYMSAIIEQVEGHNIELEKLVGYCELCPLRDKCNNDNNMTCGQFIQSQLSDGKLYRA